jgi:membrane protease YdiL (CAAX protease family)
MRHSLMKNKSIIEFSIFWVIAWQLQHAYVRLHPMSGHEFYLTTFISHIVSTILISWFHFSHTNKYFPIGDTFKKCDLKYSIAITTICTVGAVIVILIVYSSISDPHIKSLLQSRKIPIGRDFIKAFEFHDTEKILILVLINLVPSFIIAPIAEEFVFRGLLTRALNETFRIRYTRILTTLLFAFAHDIYDRGFAYFARTAFSLVLTGFLLSKIAERARSILPSIIVHGIINVVAQFIGLAGYL